MAESKKFLGQKLERIEHALTPTSSATGAATIADNVDVLSTIVAAGFYTMTTGEAITGKIDANALSSKLKSKTGGKEYSAVTMHKNISALVESFNKFTADWEYQYDQSYVALNDLNDLIHKMFGDTNQDFFATLYKVLGETIFTFEEFTGFYKTTFKKDFHPLMKGAVNAALAKYFKPLDKQKGESNKLNFDTLLNDDQFEEFRSTFEDSLVVSINDVISGLLENPKLNDFFNKLDSGASATINIAGMSDDTVSNMVASINSLYTGEIGSMQNFINGIKEFGELIAEIEKINLGDNKTKLESMIHLINDENGLKTLNFDGINFGTIPDLTPIFGDKDSFVAALIQGEENMSLVTDDLLNKFDSIQNAINKLSEIDFSVLTIPSVDMTTINELFKSPDGMLPTLFTNVNNLPLADPEKMKELEKNVDILQSTINDVVDALKSENFDKIDDNAVNKSVDIISEFINKIKVENDKAIKLDLSGLSSLFETIIKVSEMGWWKRRQMKRGVETVANIINEDIANIMNDLKENLNESEIKTVSAKINAFNSIIDILLKTTDIGIGKYIKAKIGTFIIKDFIKSNIADIIKAVNETGTEIKNIKPVLDQIKSTLSTITDVADVEKSKLEQGNDNIEYITDTLLNSIADLIDEINEFDESTISDARKVLGGDSGKEGIAGVIQGLQKLFTDVGIGSIIKDVIKINIMQMEVGTLSVMMETLNKAPKLEADVENKYKTLGKLIEDINKVKYGEPAVLKKINDEQLPALVNSIKQLEKLTNQMNQFKVVKTDNIKTLFKAVNEVNKSLKKAKTDTKKLKDVALFFNSISNISKTINKGQFDPSGVKQFQTFTNDLISVLKGKKSPINQLSKVTIGKKFELKMRDIKRAIKSLRSVGVAMGAIGALLPLLFLGKMAIGVISGGVRHLVSSLSSINMIKLKISKHNLKNIMFLMLGASAILLLGGYIISRDIKIIMGSFVFSLILSRFLKSLIHTLVKQGAKSTVAIATIGPLTALIVVSGALLLLGGLILSDNIPTIIGSLAFCILLNMFLWGIIHTITHAGKKVMFSVGQIVAITGLIVLSGALLLVGGIIIADNPKVIAGSFLFALQLGLFLWGILSIIKWAGKKTIMAAAQIWAITGLIVLSGALLLVGGIIFAQNDDIIKGSFIFAALVAGFLLAVMAIFKFVKLKDIALNIEKAGAMAILVVAAGLVVLMGAFTQTQLNSFGGWLALGLFCVTVIGFIGLMLGGFWLMEKLGLLKQKNLNMNIKNIGMMSIIVALSGALLLAAAMIIGDNPTILVNSMVFCGLMLAFSLAMWGITTVLKQMEGNVKKSILTVAALIGMIMLFGFAMWTLDLAFKSIGGGNAFVGMAISGIEFLFAIVIIGLVAVLCRIIGDPNLYPYIIAGVSCIALIVLCIMGIALTMVIMAAAFEIIRNSISKIPNMVVFALQVAAYLGILMVMTLGMISIGMSGTLLLLALPGIALTFACTMMITASIYAMSNVMDKVKPDKFKVVGTQLINAFGDIADAINDRFGGLKGLQYGLSLTFACRPIEKVAQVLSSIAESVEEYANLKVAVYAGTKKVGYRQLNKQDFKSAGENVALVITTLGDAIINTYNKNPQMFQGGGWFTNSPFDIVTKSCGKLGPMLAKIANAVREYADLSITEYDENGKEKGKRHLVEADFTNAGNNVSLIISTLGDAVIDTYNKNPQMFSSSWLSGNIFDEVVESCTGTADMLTTLAKAVSDYANMTVTEYDENGKEKGKRHLTETDFINAGQNIQKLLIGEEGGNWHGIYGTIKYIAENYGDLIFTKSGGFMGMGGDNIVDKVVDSSKTVGEMLGTLSQAIKDYSELKIPTKYDKDGKAIEFRQMDVADFIKAGVSIDMLLTGNNTGGLFHGLMGTIQDIFTNNKSLFEDDDAINDILEGVKSSSEFIGKVLEIIKNYSEMKVPALDKDGNIINGKFKPIDNAMMLEAAKNIHTVLLGDGGDWKGLCSTVVSIMEDAAATNPENKKGFWEKMFSGNSNEANMEYIKSLIESINFVGKIMDIVKNFSLMQIPATDENGNIIKDTYKTLKPEDYKQVGVNIKTMLVGDGNWKGITGEVLDAVKTVTSNTEGGDTKISEFMDTFNPILDFVSSMADTIKKFAEAKYKGTDGKEVAINGDAGLAACKNITTMMFGNEDPSKGLLSTIIGKINEIKDTIDPETVSEYVNSFNEILALIEPMSAALKSFGEMKIEVRDQEGNVVSSTDLSTVDLSTLGSKMGDIVDATIAIATKTSDDNILSSMKTVQQNAGTLNSGFTAFGTVATALWTAYATVDNAMSTAGIAAGSVNVDNINTLKTILIGDGEKTEGGLFSSGTYVHGFAGVMSVLREITDSGLFGSDIAKIGMDLVLLSSSILSIVKLADINTGLSDAGEDPFTKLTNGIKSINESIAEIKSESVKKFKQENDEIEKFVHRVNKIDMNKVNAIRTLSESLIRLSNKFGSLEGLVHALSTDMNSTLLKLVKSLEEAKETINKTDKIQSERHKKIDESIRIVKDLMDKEMIVKITQEAAQQTPSQNNDDTNKQDQTT